MTPKPIRGPGGHVLLLTAICLGTIGSQPAPAEWKPFGFLRRNSESADAKAIEATRPALIREPDGTWRENQAGATDSPVQREFAAAQQLFREEHYYKAARAFHRIAKRQKDTPIEEDALFMEAESWYRLGWIPKAQDTYAQLLTKHPTTRHLPDAVQRTYDIAYHWLEDSRLRSQGEEGKYVAATQRVNLFDWSRPMFDTNGRAIEAIETIQQYDPFGPLADDAAMMAGAHKFSSGEYIQAASYYERLSIDQPKSQYTTRALTLGAQAYLRAYQGPEYDGQDLDNAYRLTKAALRRGNQLPQEERQRMENDLRVIYLELAKRDFATAQQYARLRKPESARYYFELVKKKYPDTDWARRADEELGRLASQPTRTESYVARLFAGSNDRSRAEKKPVAYTGETMTPADEKNAWAKPRTESAEEESAQRLLKPAIQLD